MEYSFDKGNSVRTLIQRVSKVLFDEKIGGQFDLLYGYPPKSLFEELNHREEETKKGMDASQITGSCSSYSRKYALNGLLAIDDTKDADATNKHEAEEPTYIKVHESLEDLEIAIDSCENKNELTKLYNLNKESIGNDKNIIQLFANKKKSL